MDPEIIKKLDRYSDEELDVMIDEVLKGIPYWVQPFVSSNNDLGTFFRIKTDSESWYSSIESFFPYEKQYLHLNRCGGPDNALIMYCCDEIWWNVLSELINHRQDSSGKISILSFKVANPQSHTVGVMFSKQYADSLAQSNPIASKCIHYLIEYFYRNTGDKEHDYRVSGLLSKKFLGDLVVKHPNAIGMQYMPVRRCWLPEFGQTYNYAFILERLKPHILSPCTVHMEYYVDTKDQKFFFRNRWVEKWDMYPIASQSAQQKNKADAKSRVAY